MLANSKVLASYPYCDKKIENSDYYDCGRYIYSYYEDTLNSTMLFTLGDDESFLYAGKRDGVDVFYADGFKYYNVSYDDRSDSNNNRWSVISTRGKVVYNGSFSDSGLIDDGHRGTYYYNMYKDVYALRQYSKKDGLIRTLVIYNVEDQSISLSDIKYDGREITSDSINEVLESNDGISMKINSNYGIRKIAITLDDVNVDYDYRDGRVFISKEDINSKLVKGKPIVLKVTVTNYFGYDVETEYSLKLLNYNVSISFETLSSVNKSNSRRIVINAIAGKDKKIDKAYCWYYWSTSDDDSLQYEDFLVNYTNSEHKGSYSQDKGVILRNTSGKYYLYALAKDDDSFIIERSEGYDLNNKTGQVKHTISDAIFLVSLAIVAIIPVSIYLSIRKRGY